MARLAAVSLLILALGACAPEAPPPPARIVLIVVDMLRRDHVGAYGASRPTPNLDRVAQGGQVVKDALSSYGSTKCSMAALFTGRTPSLGTDEPEEARFGGPTSCGMARFADRPDHRCLPETLPTLAEGMRALGYETLGVTSNLFLYDPDGFSRGFEHWIEVGARTLAELEADAPRPTSGAYGGTLAPSVNAAVRDVLERRSSDRFFLYVHFMDVHDHAEVGQSYAEGVARADAGVGALLDELARRGLLEDALVVLTSDHGERLGELHAVRGMPQHYGNPTFDYLLEVPLLASRPVLPEDGPPIRGQDLGGLLLAAAGGEAPPPADVAQGELFLSEWVWQGLRVDGWKLMRRRDGGRRLLMDLARDPLERRDVAPAQPERVRALEERLDEIATLLGARPVGRSEWSEEERRRLEALGYVASPEEAEALWEDAPAGPSEPSEP